MIIQKKAKLLLLAAVPSTAFAFSALSSFARTPTTSIKGENQRAAPLSMSDDGSDSGTKITSVNNKEIFFDGQRFFETRLVSDEVEQADTTGVTGPFKDGLNPFKKPEGSFFDQFGKAGSSEEAAPTAPAASTPPPAQENTAPAFASFFQKQDEAPEQSVAPAVKASPAETKAESSPSPFAIFDNFFKPVDPEVVEPEITYDEVEIKPDFRVAALFLSSGLLLDQVPYIQLTLGPLVTLLGILFLVQTFRVRFLFTESNELVLLSGNEEPGENVVVGGANRWACDTIVNYDFFPAIDSSPVGPILVYFKETQTPSESWNEGPGAIANSGEGKVQGQVHFFPAVCSGEQIRAEFEKRGCGKV